jgi:DNA-binding transcriptional regulator YiaG
MGTSTTIPDFTQDAMDSMGDNTIVTTPAPMQKSTRPSGPNITKVMQKSPYWKSALWVSELRRRLNLTQVGFSQAIGVSSATVGSWERGDSHPLGEKHQDALIRAGRTVNMPDPPPSELSYRGQHYIGPRFDPQTEELFKQHFGS